MRKYKLILKNKINLFISEPLLWATLLSLIWFSSKIRSVFYSKLLNAPEINIGSGCSIRGIRCISMGRAVSIYGGLWLEAVQNYRNQSFTPKINIGDRVSFSKDVHVTCIEQIEIGNGVLFGSRVYVSDHNHGQYSGEIQSHPDEPPSQRILSLGGPVIIEDNVWIGDNVVILGPAKIGAGAILGANSVVKGEIPKFMMVAGAPAKPIKEFDHGLKIWRKI